MTRILKGATAASLLVGLLACGLFAEEPVQTESCRTALIAINLDLMTVGFAGTGAPFPADWRTVDDRHVVEANADLIPTARDAGVLIIYLYGSYERLEEGQALATYAEEIAPQEGDILIGRPGPNLNVFTDTILLETLEARGIRNLLFSGLNTGYCINRSSQWGSRLGFDVTVVADAHSGGTPQYAQSYNEYWPTLGIAVVPISELDFTALCEPGEDIEPAEGEEG
jgi:nicotinamidase-related amidase